MLTSSCQPSSNSVSACRTKSQSDFACFAAAANCGPRPGWGTVIIVAPAVSAIWQLLSIDPPSVMMTSLIMPAIRARIRLCKVAGKVVSAFNVGMMTDSIACTLLGFDENNKTV